MTIGKKKIWHTFQLGDADCFHFGDADKNEIGDRHPLQFRHNSVHASIFVLIISEPCTL